MDQNLPKSTCIDECKIEKVLRYAHFDQKNTHISECKIVHKCISVTVTVHICMIIVTRAFNILVFFGSVGYVREREGVVSEEIIKKL